MINADLGLRVIDVEWGDFDSHGQQLQMHPQRLAELDAGLRLFFLNLDDRFRSAVTILTTSEFGRTPYANDSGGTDHGAASSLFLIGSGVQGGLHGQYPSLAGLQRWDDLQATVDFRSVFSAVLDGWMGGGGQTITNVAPLAGLFRTGPGEDVASGAPPASVPSDFTSVRRPCTSSTRAAARAAGAASRPVTTRRSRSTREDRQHLAGRRHRRGVEPHRRAADRRQLGDRLADRRTAAEATSVNFAKGANVPNLVIAKVGASARVNVYNASGQTHYLADLVGTFSSAAGQRLVPLSPFRLLDTRAGKGAPAKPVGAGGTIAVTVVGVAGSGVPATGVDSVVLNVTACRR